MVYNGTSSSPTTSDDNDDLPAMEEKSANNLNGSTCCKKGWATACILFTFPSLFALVYAGQFQDVLRTETWARVHAVGQLFSLLLSGPGGIWALTFDKGPAHSFNALYQSVLVAVTCVQWFGIWILGEKLTRDAKPLRFRLLIPVALILYFFFFYNLFSCDPY